MKPSELCLSKQVAPFWHGVLGQDNNSGAKENDMEHDNDLEKWQKQKQPPSKKERNKNNQQNTVKMKH